MSALLLLAAAVAALGPRPPSLTGDPPQAYAEWLHERVLLADRAFGREACPAAQTRSLSGRTLSEAEMTTVAVARRAGSPVYLERVRLTGCGRASTHNIQVVRMRRGGRWSGIALLPGEGRATPNQQTRAMQTMAMVALNGSPALPCPSSEALRSMIHGETRVIGSSGADWTERWPLRLCGADRTVDVRFGQTGLLDVTPAWTAPGGGKD